MSDIQKFGEEFQRVGKDGFDASVRSFGEVNKGLQAIAATVTDYSKKAFEDGTRAFEQLIGAKSFEQAFEIQSQYAKKAFDAYVAQTSKLGEMYVDLARSAYKPVEQLVAKTAKRRSANARFIVLVRHKTRGPALGSYSLPVEASASPWGRSSLASVGGAVRPVVPETKQAAW